MGSDLISAPVSVSLCFVLILSYISLALVPVFPVMPGLALVSSLYHLLSLHAISARTTPSHLSSFLLLLCMSPMFFIRKVTE